MTDQRDQNIPITSMSRIDLLLFLSLITFASPDRFRDLVERGNGFKVSADRQAFDYAVGIGRGGVYLNLTQEQYAKLSVLPSSNGKERQRVP